MIESASRRVLILGGTRSGKSDYALGLARELGGDVVFVATAWPSDEAMGERIAAHRAARPPHWRTLEVGGSAAAAIRTHAAGADVVLLDCVTLLVAGLVAEADGAAEPVRREVEELAHCLGTMRCHFILVSNEVGLGVVPPTPLGHRFAEALGWANRRLAEAANEVYLLVAGLPVPIKKE